MKRFLALFVAVICATAFARPEIPLARSAYELGKEFDSADAWKQSGDDFVQAHRFNYFRFLDADKKDSANAIREGRVTYHGLEVYETRVWFVGKDQPGVTRIELSLYNKGDATKTLNASELGALLKTVRGTLCEEGTKSPQPESKNMGDGALQKSQTWKTRTPAAAQLTWRYQKKGREVEVDFVRLTLVNATAGGASAGKELTAKKETQSRGSVRKNVVRVTTDGENREKAGDVYIANVPMVDQGAKGYCAVATSERVLRYYGLAIDEHELGATAGSTADGGTSVEAMYETVRKLGSRYRLGTYPVVGGVNRKNEERAQNFLKEIENYNRMARKMKKQEIAKSVYMRGMTIDANAANEAMEPDVLKAVRVKNPKFRTFAKGIHDQVNAGVPLIWSVTLGLFPEPDIPQASGGHMRLIIGYNDKTKEIVYTDTWGAKHAYKRMPIDNAWTITSALFYLRPTKE